MKKLFVYLMLSVFFMGTGLSATSIESSKDNLEISLQDKKEIEKEDLPQAVQQALKEDRFQNYSINKIYEVTGSDRSKYYAVEFDYGGGQTTTINFDKHGEIIRN